MALFHLDLTISDFDNFKKQCGNTNLKISYLCTNNESFAYKNTTDGYIPIQEKHKLSGIDKRGNIMYFWIKVGDKDTYIAKLDIANFTTTTKSNATIKFTKK